MCGTSRYWHAGALPACPCPGLRPDATTAGLGRGLRLHGGGLATSGDKRRGRDGRAHSGFTQLLMPEYEVVEGTKFWFHR